MCFLIIFLKYHQKSELAIFKNGTLFLDGQMTKNSDVAISWTFSEQVNKVRMSDSRKTTDHILLMIKFKLSSNK